MAKIGTVQVAIEPYLTDEAREALAASVASAVSEGIRRGLAQSQQAVGHGVHGAVGGDPDLAGGGGASALG